MLFRNIKRLLSNSRDIGLKYKMSFTIKDVVERLEQFAPLNLAESWDNVGLLIDPITDKPVNNILLTNDLTEDVVDEAIKKKAEFIITYHPNIFQGLKSVSSRTWKERIVVQCLKNEIAVYSPHTTWDSVNGGVNDWLASVFKYSSITPIKPTVDNPLQGPGRKLTLQNPEPLDNIITNIKKHIGIPHLRLGLAKHKTIESTVSTVALCAGSGASLLNGLQADLYLTGEMLHHDILDATQKGIHVILCNHSDSERGFLSIFQNKLQNDILGGQVQVHISNIDCDPVKTV